MFVVVARGDIAADFVEVGGDLEEEGIVGGELVDVLKFGEEAVAEEGDVLGVFGIGLVSFAEDLGVTHDLCLDVGGEGIGDEEVEEEAAFVVGVGDLDVVEAEVLGDSEVGFESGEEGFGGVVVELVSFHAFFVTEEGGLGDEVAEFFEGGTRGNFSG